MTTIRRSLCLLVVLAGAALAVEPIVLVDFEEAAKATPLLKVRHPKAELSTEQASQGKASLKMAFEKYEPGKPEWPMVSIPLGQAGLPKDWSSARFWAFDVFTPLAEGCVLRSLVNNEDKREWYQGHPVPPGKWTTIYIDLRGVAASVDLKSLARMAFYMTRPPADTIIYLDNVRLLPPTTESPDAVKLSLVSPSFHGGFFASHPTDKIRVQAVFDAPREEVAECVLTVTLRDDKGKELNKGELRDLGELRGGEGLVELPAPMLADGQTVTLRAELRRKAAVLTSMERMLTRFPKSKDEVVIREDGVTLVNGAPFFPFGMYQSPVSEFGYLKSLGFNSLHSYSPVDADYLKAAEQAGLRVLTQVKGTFSKPPDYHEPLWDAVKVEEYVRSIKDSPALLGYYLYDEPSIAKTSKARLTELVDIARRADPYHIAAGCNNQDHRAYAGVPDAMMPDVYPIRDRNRLPEIVSEVTEAATAQRPCGAVWFIPQAFSWEPYFMGGSVGKDGHPVPPFPRLPTFDETRTMPWLGIASGAKGLFYYSFQTQGFYVRDAYPVFWRGYVESVKEIAALLPILVQPDAPSPARADKKEIVTLAKQVGSDLFLIAASASDAQVEATITLPALGGRTLFVLSEQRQVTPKGDQFSDTFQPAETHLYATSAALPALRPLSEIRAELAALDAQFREQDRSVCAYRDGATLDASWGFPKGVAASWYRMIDGFPGTSWVVGTGFRLDLIKDEWARKDFRAKDRWIEVRLKEKKPLTELVAIVSPHSVFELRVLDGETWRTVTGAKAVDKPPRHHQHASATTMARFQPVLADRFRLVFPEERTPSASADIVFELLAR